MVEVQAHPGNTASDGCHYCRTNCDYWGEEYGERHCHNGSSDEEDVDYEDDSDYEDYEDDSDYEDYEDDSDYEEDEDDSDYEEDEDTTIYWIIGSGFVGYICYLVGKKNN